MNGGADDLAFKWKGKTHEEFCGCGCVMVCPYLAGSISSCHHTTSKQNPGDLWGFTWRSCGGSEVVSRIFLVGRKRDFVRMCWDFQGWEGDLGGG